MTIKKAVLILIAAAILLIIVYAATTLSRRKSDGGGEGASSGYYGAQNPFPNMRQVQVPGAATSTKTDYRSDEQPVIKIDLNSLTQPSPAANP